MPAFNDDNLVTYWSRVRTLVDTCLSNMGIHPMNAYGGTLYLRAKHGWVPPVTPEELDYTYGIIGGYSQSVWYSYYDGGYYLPYETVIPTEMFNQDSNVRWVSAPLAQAVEASAFDRCQSLRWVSLPMCVTIGSVAFQNCYSMATIDLPLCESIGSYAFNNCNIAGISLPACISVGNYAFNQCDEISAADLPVCTTIGNSAFNGCDKIATVDAPNCTVIGSNAFAYCSKLSSVNVPVCASIGNWTFSQCFKLARLDLTSVPTVPMTYMRTFWSTPIEGYTTYTSGRYGSVYVPASLYSQFLSASYWSDIVSRIVSV